MRSELKTATGVVRVGRSIWGRAGLAIAAAWLLAATPAGGADGDLDPTFGDGGVVMAPRIGTMGQHASASAMVRQGDGKLVLGGTTSLNVGYGFALVRYQANGTLDPSFGGGSGKVLARFAKGSTSRLSALALQPDGKIVAAGSTSRFFALARFDPSGTLDASFGDEGQVITELSALRSAVARAVAVQPDGKIVAAGYVETGPASRSIALVRYEVDGALDTGFGDGGRVVTAIGSGGAGAEALIVQPDGGLVIAGTGMGMTVVSYLADGSLDTSFGADGIAHLASQAVAYALLRQADGKLVAAGYKVVPALGTREAFIIGRLNADGTIDAGFGTDGVTITEHRDHSYFFALAQQPDGKLIAAGGTSGNTGYPAYDFAVFRYGTNGSLDPSFGSGGKVVTAMTDHTVPDVATDLVLLPDGKVVAGGHTYTGFTTFAVARYSTSGALDPTFGSGGKVVTVVDEGMNVPFTALRQEEGQILTAGAAGTVVHTDFALSRFDVNGTLDPTFGSGGTLTTPVGNFRDAAGAVLRQADGKIVAAGSARIGDLDRFALLRFHPDGSPDPSFGTAGMVTTAINLSGASHGYPRAIVEQADGKLVVAGQAADWGGSPVGIALVRYSASGAPDTSFGNAGRIIKSTTWGVGAMMAQSDGRLVVATSDFAVHRFDANGVIDATFGFGGRAPTGLQSTPGYCCALAVQPDDRVVMAGDVFVGSGNRAFALARLTPGGALDSEFGSGGIAITDLGFAQEYATAVALQGDGRIVLAGSVGSTHGYLDLALARYEADGQLDATFGAGGSAVYPVSRYDDIPVSVLWEPRGRLVVVARSVDPFGNTTVALSGHVVNVCGDGTIAGEEACDEGDGNGAPDSCCTETCEVRPAGQVCRPAAGFCDVEEVCAGTDGHCPPDALAAPSVECRASAGDCDPAESCSGADAHCPPDNHPPCTPTPTATPPDTPTAPPTPAATPSATPTPAGSASPTAETTPSVIPVCPEQPRGDCRQGLRSRLVIRLPSETKRRRIAWTLTRAESTDALEFADPTRDAWYSWCIYESSALFVGAQIPPGENCRGRSCWTRVSARVHRYDDRDATHDGVRRLLLVASDRNRARIALRAEGSALPQPTRPLPLPESLDVVVQLSNVATGACWESRFGPGDLRRSTLERFVAARAR